MQRDTKYSFIRTVHHLEMKWNFHQGKPAIILHPRLQTVERTLLKSGQLEMQLMETVRKLSVMNTGLRSRP